MRKLTFVLITLLSVMVYAEKYGVAAIKAISSESSLFAYGMASQAVSAGSPVFTIASAPALPASTTGLTTTQAAQLVVGEPTERGYVFQVARVQGGHGVQAEQLQPHHAEVDAVQGVVVEAGGAERTTVADAVPQDAPGVASLTAVFPQYTQHIAVVVGLGEAEPEGPPRCNGSRHKFTDRATRATALFLAHVRKGVKPAGLRQNDKTESSNREK